MTAPASLSVTAKLISYSSYRRYELFIRISAQFASKRFDVHIQSTRFSHEIVIPYLRKYGVSFYYAVGIFHQKRQQIVFFQSQRDSLPLYVYGMLGNCLSLRSEQFQSFFRPLSLLPVLRKFALTLAMSSNIPKGFAI